MTTALTFPAAELPEGFSELRSEVRSFLADELRVGGFAPLPGGWNRFDPEFSRKVASRGWVGMTLPKQYGGHGRSALERYVVNEELLTAGAPVWAHWIADRQVAPSIVKFGTEEQRKLFLPRIAQGQCYFCVGYSEAGAGSDLSSVKTKATRVPGGWKINGRKIWTTDGHRADTMILLARTSAEEGDRHGGLTQFLLEMTSPGITVTPIINLAGDHEFNEVLFEDVFVGDGMVLGQINRAWSQLTADLANERSGPERWLSTFQLFKNLLELLKADETQQARQELGRIFSHIWSLRQLSLSVAIILESGEDPVTQAAIVKDLGTALEQEIPEVARKLLSESRRAQFPAGVPILANMQHDILTAPSFTIRGGTREILRGTIARGIGLR